MAKRKATTVNPDDLNPREGKVLRYFVSRKRNGDNQTAAEDCIVETPWSDLPHTAVQAVMTLSSLVSKGLVIKVQDGWYAATVGGDKLIGIADKTNAWQTAPPPSVTNNPEHIEAKLQDYRSTKSAAKPKPKAKPKAKSAAKPKPKPKAKPKARGPIHIKKAR